MPAFTDQTPREKITVQGINLTIPYVYSADVIAEMDEAEQGKVAKFVNQRLEGIMINAYGGDIRRELLKIASKRAADHRDGKYKGPWLLDDEGNPVKGEHGKQTPAVPTVDDLDWDHQARIDEKFGRYKVGEDNTREAVAKDPTDKIAWGIAAQEVKNRFIAKGWKVKPAMDTKNEEHGTEFNKLVHDRLNHPAHKDRIYALAKQQIESGKEEDEDDFDVPEHLRQPTAAAAAAANGDGEVEPDGDEDEGQEAGEDDEEAA